jgi:PAS domain S-box-containing protein
MRWIDSRYADLIPLLASVIVLGAVFLVDRERAGRLESAEAAAAARAGRQAAVLADEVGNALSERLGAIAGLELQWDMRDTLADEAFMAAFDSVTGRFAGVMAISAVDPATDEVHRGSGALLDRTGFRIAVDTVVRNPYLRALVTKEPAATGLLEIGDRPRVVVFDPIVRGDDDVQGVIAAELDPALIVRAAVTRGGVIDTLRGTYYAVFGPHNVRATTPATPPAGWPRVERRVRLADTEWAVEIAYQPVDPMAFRAERVALWASGLAAAVALALILFVLRRTVAGQREELARRRVAEQAAKEAADEASRSAREARELAVQLEAAQRAAQQLSTSLNPDDVVDLFLGGVAEILDADVASLYTFADEGEVLVGRRRVVFRDVGPPTERFRTENFQQVRAPVALLPVLAEAVATGEPYVHEQGAGSRGLSGVVVGPDTAAASVTVPLLIGGHAVGVATWEVHTEPRTFLPAHVAFAQALAAPAAAALRTAELFATVEAERARAEHEALRFGTVLDQMADGVIVVDAAGRVERTNQAAEELLGDAIRTTPIEQWSEHFELMSVEGRPLASHEFPLTRALRGDRVRRATFIVRSAWAGERHLSGSAAPILSPTGETTGAAMVLRDVSDEHQYAEMLRHTNRELRRQADVLEQVNQQLRDATKAKDQFLAVMSHELRTPINAIMGYSDLLDLGVKGQLNQEQRAMVGRVRETSRHLLGLINEVLDLAKIGAGRMDLALVEVDAAEIVERAAQQILPMAAAKGLRLDVVPPENGEDTLVVGDETRLTQIVINLLSNAVKFTQQGGVTVRYGVRGEGVEIRVRDTGPGIPAEQHERVFEEFYQVEGGLARATGGTGLGLAIARRFARLMGGDITIESETGDGAEFVVRLPSAAGSEGDGRPRTRAIALLAHGTAAFERTRQDLAGRLRVLGGVDPTTFRAATRHAGVRLAAVDALAPDDVAWRALASLAGDGETSPVPILLFSHGDEEGETAIEIGRFRIIGKPLDLERAATTVLGAAQREETPVVLICESDPDTRRILNDALAARGCETRAVGNGADALDVLARTAVSVVVVDLLCPGVSGLEVMARAHADPSIPAVPFIVVLARELSDDDMRRLRELAESLLPTSPVRDRPTAALIEKAVSSNDDQPSLAEASRP